MDPVLDPISDPPINSNEIPPTPPAPPTEPAALPTEVLNAYNSMISDRNAENQRLRNQVAALEAARNAPPPLTAEEQSKAFFENPVDLIRREINAAVQPINESLAVSRRATEYANLKSQMKADPRFSDLDSIGTEFDALMNGQPLDHNLMIAA
jgi:hypothetical protein